MSRHATGRSAASHRAASGGRKRTVERWAAVCLCSALGLPLVTGCQATQGQAKQQATGQLGFFVCSDLL